MKRITAILLCISLLTLAACGGSASGAAPASEHSHTAENWSADHQNHWRSCPDCGTEYDKAAHTIENDKCTVCLTDVIKSEDGTVQITCYNQHGDEIAYASYAADGSEESRNEYEYSADGNKMTERSYYMQKLQYESVYDITDGNQILFSNTTYYEDGSIEGSEYDQYGNSVAYFSKTADGNIESEFKFEHEYDEEGRITLTKSYENGRLTHEQEYINGSDEEGEWSRSGKNISYHADGSKTVCDADPDGAWSSEITYDPQGNVTEEIRYEYEYNENGDQTVGRTYNNGVLTETMEAVADENGETEFIIRTRYLEDGGKRVCKYDTNFDVVEETTYDADGKVKAN